MALMAPVLVPPANPNTTVAPPVVSAFPAASLACKNSVSTPPDVSDAANTVTVDVAAEMAPAPTVIVGSAVPTGVALTVAPIVVALPAVTPVNVAL